MRPSYVIGPDTIDFAAYERETEAKARVRPAKAYLRDMSESLGKPEPVFGQALPWAKAEGVFRFRPGEVTIWAGVNGHGKSLLSGMIALDLVMQAQRVCIASFEMKPHRTLERMLRQWCGYAPDEFAGHPDAIGALRDLYEQFGTVADGRLWFYDQQGSVDARRVLAVTRYAAQELGINHVFVDNLAKVVRGTDDYNGQKDFVSELCTIAADHEVHVHLVHHIRKLENELRRPDKTDVKGAGEITDLVDNVLLVWRNKAEGGNRKTADADAALICCKQRHGTGWEGGINLWFDAPSRQYTEAAGETIDFARRAA